MSKAKKFRKHRTHGRGKKAGRGSGLRGGRGMAGINKHRRTTMIMIERATNRPYWGRVGFKRAQQLRTEHSTMNVGRLEEAHPGTTSIDLVEAGVDKLLGAGKVRSALQVRVKYASSSAVEKIEAAGGKVELVAASGGENDQASG
jgi:large subunit ribosomal protein L15